MKSITKLFFAFALLITLVACENENPFSGFRAYFKCDTAYHPFNQVTSYGQFITVRPKNSYSAYEVTDANGNRTTHNLTEVELREKFQFGSGGLIIGTPALGDGTIWVYDLTCTSCATARDRLNVAHDGSGLASCSKCGSVFDLNNEGIAVKGKSHPLWRYKYTMLGTELIIRN
ncbi:MAG: hypothetical protein IKU35_02360 [Bacteroidaceae bacterium]|nr:hypothetical protein [Bacteroidaceae bacterium]